MKIICYKCITEFNFGFSKLIKSFSSCSRCILFVICIYLIIEIIAHAFSDKSSTDTFRFATDMIQTLLCLIVVSHLSLIKGK